MLLQSFARIAGGHDDLAAVRRYLGAADAYRHWNGSQDPPVVRDRLQPLREAAFAAAGENEPDPSADGHQPLVNLAEVARGALAGDARSVTAIVEALGP